MKAIIFLFTVMLFVLMACQPQSAAEAPTVASQDEATQAEDTVEPVATAIPPTETVEPATPTAIPPTATAEPTATEVPPTLTKEPLPEPSVETLTGTWTHFEQESGGNNWLILNADGTYQAKHGPSVEEGLLVLEGTYTVENGVITFTDAEDCPDGEPYDVHFSTADRIRFDLKELCGSEQLLPEHQPSWKRFEE